MWSYHSSLPFSYHPPWHGKLLLGIQDTFYSGAKFLRLQKPLNLWQLTLSLVPTIHNISILCGTQVYHHLPASWLGVCILAFLFPILGWYKEKSPEWLQLWTQLLPNVVLFIIGITGCHHWDSQTNHISVTFCIISFLPSSSWTSNCCPKPYSAFQGKRLFLSCCGTPELTRNRCSYSLKRWPLPFPPRGMLLLCQPFEYNKKNKIQQIQTSKTVRYNSMPPASGPLRTPYRSGYFLVSITIFFFFN